MKRITSRFVMLIATAAVLPLIVYGSSRWAGLKEGTETSVREGNLEVAEQVASQLKLYVDNNARILRSVGQELSATSLAPWQQTRILTNHVLEFPEFREISLLDASGRTIATSRIGGSRARLPLHARAFDARRPRRRRVPRRRCAADDGPVGAPEGEDDQGLAGRPAVARGAVALRRHACASVRRGYALVFGRSAAHRPRRSGEEADGGAVRNRTRRRRCRRPTC